MFGDALEILAGIFWYLARKVVGIMMVIVIGCIISITIVILSALFKGLFGG